MADVAMVTIDVLKCFYCNPIVMKLHKNDPWDVQMCIQG